MPEVKAPKPPSPEWADRIIAEVKDFYSNLRLLQYEIQDWQSNQEEKPTANIHERTEAVFVLHKIAGIAYAVDAAMRESIAPPTQPETPTKGKTT